MAKAKSGNKKVPPKKSKVVEPEESGSDVEVIQEIQRDEDGGSDTSNKRGSRGRKPRGGSKSAPARSSRRETKSKSYREEDPSDVSSVEEQAEEKAAKKKKAVKKVIELAFSKSEDTTEEEANDKDGEEEEEPLPEIDDGDDEVPEEKKPEKASSKAGTSNKRGRGRPIAKAPAPAKKSKKGETKGEEDEVVEEDADPDAEYEVEKILEVKFTKNKREFLVKWKGFSMTETTWEPEANLQHAKDLLDIFLSKVDKNDLSRTRRLSTIQSTKSSRGHSETRSSSSSSAPLTRTREGRVSKSRSRTPRIGSTTSSSTSSAPKLDKLSSVREDEESDEARSLTKLRTNGDLSLQKFMRESVERKLEQLKDKHKLSTGSTILDTKEVLSSTNVRPNRIPIRSKFGRMARTVLACGVAVSVGAAALVFTNPETLNWEQISPQLQQVLESVRTKYHEAYSQVQNHAPF